ncbi:MAG: hypothetical protein RJA41_487 [Actinomycetota bacterium]
MSENQNLDLFDEVVDEQQSVEATPAAEESFTESFSASAESAEEEVAVVEEALADAKDEDEEVDPVQEFKDALLMKSGDWYVIHSYAGYEKRVKENLESRIRALEMEAFIYEVAIPFEEVTEIKNQKPKKVMRNKLPGYILVRANLDSDEVGGDKAWGTIRHTPGVTGFIGANNHPIALSLDEVANILAPKPEKKSSASQPGVLAPKIEVLDFAVGDSVTIIDGPFTSVQTTISEINVDAQKVIGLVEIFGRETQVELAFNQVQRND